MLSLTDDDKLRARVLSRHLIEASKAINNHNFLAPYVRQMSEKGSQSIFIVDYDTESNFNPTISRP